MLKKICQESRPQITCSYHNTIKNIKGKKKKEWDYKDNLADLKKNHTELLEMKAELIFNMQWLVWKARH